MPVITSEDLDELTTPVSDPGWDYLAGLPAALTGSKPDIAAFRGALTEGDQRLKQRFEEDEPVERLVRDRARLVDALLKTAWTLHLREHVRELALIAVGGGSRTSSASSRSCGTSGSKSATACARSMTASARAPRT
jgi:[protein-PII] uridylyltransferase